MSQSPLLEIGPDDPLLDAEHPLRHRVHAHLDPVNQAFAIGLHSGKERVGQRLIHEEEVIVTVPEHDRPGVLLRAHLDVRKEGLESPGHCTGSDGAL
jgi:hypothetical protein